MCAAPNWADAPPQFQTEGAESLIVFNRILAKVNGKTLSVIDVMRKMDLFLQRNYPHLVDSKVARYQFYSSQWRETLAQMIDQELMIADAERLELKVTDAEVREEMLERFGPTIMSTLDKLDMSYEEARQMIHSEMIVQRMMWFRVNSKALNQVNPQDIKEAYRAYCQQNPALEEWKYEVLSLRSPQSDLSAMVASKAFELLGSARGDFSSVIDQIKAESTEENLLTVSLTPDLRGDEHSLAQSHQEVLKTLVPGAFSAPVAQVSRVDQSVVYRIFHLKEHAKKEVPAFEKLADKLKDSLLDQAVTKENTQYIAKLRERLGYDEKHMLESLPDDFQPFALK
jgi:hypothetical protein